MQVFRSAVSMVTNGRFSVWCSVLLWRDSSEMNSIKDCFVNFISGIDFTDQEKCVLNVWDDGYVRGL